MIRHSLKMIWAERKSNFWISIELVLVFSILWFCSGFIYEKGKQFLEPVGVDINHTYLLQFDFRKNVREEDIPQDYDRQQDALTIFNRLKQYPGIESCCFSTHYSTPYSGSYSSNGIDLDSVNYSYVMKTVSPEYFDVFKVKFQVGQAFSSNEINSKNQVVASPDKDNKFFKEDIIHLKKIVKKDLDPTKKVPEGTGLLPNEEWEKYLIDVPLTVTGAVNKIKRSEYQPYQRNIFSPIAQADLQGFPWMIPISIRVKPQDDKQFVQKFKKDMGEQLKVGPFELFSIIPYSEIRTNYLRDTGFQDKMETVAVIVFFLLVNVFLGILGTFRFRTNARRGEIGLRAALGSSKKKIQQLLLTETFLMLFLASIPGTIIALNIQLSGMLSKLGVSFLENSPNSMTDIVESYSNMFALKIYLMTYLVTFVMMLIIIWLGTWYPARKASKIQPAEALHYE